MGKYKPQDKITDSLGYNYEILAVVNAQYGEEYTLLPLDGPWAGHQISWASSYVDVMWKYGTPTTFHGPKYLIGDIVQDTLGIQVQILAIDYSNNVYHVSCAGTNFTWSIDTFDDPASGLTLVGNQPVAPPTGSANISSAQVGVSLTKHKAKHVCMASDMVKYEGFTEVYNFCKVCDKKQEIRL